MENRLPQPIVTVIIPVYNREHSLNRALDSLMAQELTEWRAIIVDDGSTDASRAVAHRYLKKDQRFQFVALPHRGLVTARNRGLAEATTDFIAFLDSDDMYRPNHLSSRISYLLAHPGIDILHGGVEVVGDPYVLDRRDRKSLIHVREVVVAGSIVGRRAVFADLNGFADLDYSEDADLIDRALVKGYTVERFDLPTYQYYRDDLESLTHQALKESQGGS